LLDLYSPLLVSDDLQFGFKKKIGCSNVLFILRQVIEYFNNKGSNVYMASIDASKAFDRINHYKLFSLLISKGLPYVFVMLIINWYSKLVVSVKWNNSLSSQWHVTSGVRQGGILSPILFNVYVDKFITSLRSLGLGCYYHGLYIGCLMYADDMLLLSASVCDLQSMLNHCNNIGICLGIKFNASKTNCLAVGPTIFNYTAAKMTLGALPIRWANNIKYLGVSLVAGKYFSIKLSEIRRKYFSSINLILSKCSFVSDLVKLRLVESHCLPILLYAIESMNLKRDELAEINYGWNLAFRKIFNFNR
jgi:hypothetical protein